MRWVSARVLPLPAPATINTGPSACRTASRWIGFRPSRSGEIGRGSSGTCTKRSDTTDVILGSPAVTRSARTPSSRERVRLWVRTAGVPAAERDPTLRHVGDGPEDGLAAASFGLVTAQRIRRVLMVGEHLAQPVRG